MDLHDLLGLAPHLQPHPGLSMATKLLKNEQAENQAIPPPPGGGSWRWDGSAWQPNEEPAIEPVIDQIAEPAATDSDSTATT